MESAKIQILDAQILDKVHTLAGLIRIARRSRKSKTFIPKRNHVVAIQTANVSRDVRRPVVNDIGATCLAARLVRRLPSKDSGRLDVAADDSSDVGLVLRLRLSVGVPAFLRSTESSHVGRHAAVVAPVVDKIDDELDTALLGGLDDVVQALKAVGAGVDLRAGRGEELVLDGAGRGLPGDVVEAPDAQDLEAGGDVVENGVDVAVVGEEADPVRVGTGEVPRFAIDGETCAVPSGRRR